MTKFICSLQTKLTASFVMLILVVSSLTFFYTFGETKKALKETVRAELLTVASVVAADLNGKDADILKALKAGDENTQEFLYIQQKLKKLNSAHPDIKYIYTMRKDGDSLKFIVDPAYGDEEDPGAAIDEAYEDTTDEMFIGFEKPAAEKEFTTDKWGTTISGYCPFKDSEDNIAGIVGIDMASDTVIAKQNFIGRTIYLIIGIGILLAAFIVSLFSMTIIRDIKLLNKIADEISTGNMDVNMTVKRNDEIGALAESFGRMVASLKIMMSKDIG